MATPTSKCKRKAHAYTRRILEALANNIDYNTRQTEITAEALLLVKKC